MDYHFTLLELLFVFTIIIVIFMASERFLFEKNNSNSSLTGIDLKITAPQADVVTLGYRYALFVLQHI